MRRQPFPRKPLGFLDLRGGHLGGDDVAVLTSILFALRCRQVQQHVRLDVVLWDADAVVVHVGEIELGAGITLVSGKNGHNSSRDRTVANANKRFMVPPPKSATRTLAETSSLRAK